eukprot:7369905-Pyramimonas_sp.AAC.1
MRRRMSRRKKGGWRPRVHQPVGRERLQPPCPQGPDLGGRGPQPSALQGPSLRVRGLVNAK